MVMRWVEEVDRFEGTGTLRDKHGRKGPVPYRLIVEQSMRERPALNQPTETVGGGFKLSGTVVPGSLLGSLDFEHNLFLTIEDGREVEIIVTTIAGPRDASPFVVAKAPGFFK